MFMMTYQDLNTPNSTLKDVNKPTVSVTVGSNTASKDFYQVLAKDDENLVFCPLSLNILLAEITIAARGNTSKELKTALHLNVENKDIESGYKDLLKDLQDDILKIATRIYPKIGVTLVPEFVTTVQTNFNSDVQKLDYSDGVSAAKIINTFVENSTNNKIHNLISADSVSNETILLLVNAVHFKGEWSKQFKNIDLKQTFYKSNDTKVETEMMKSTGNYSYKEIVSLDAKVLEIPYKKKEYKMIIVLPNKIDGLREMENKLTNFEEIFNNLTVEKVKVTLPKFQMDMTIELNDACKKLGIQTMFTPVSDLSGLTKDHIYVSRVIQHTYIKVDEHGAEAAATTAISSLSKMGNPMISPPIIFTADHPFIFILMKGKMILFLGRLSKL